MYFFSLYYLFTVLLPKMKSKTVPVIWISSHCFKCYRHTRRLLMILDLHQQKDMETGDVSSHGNWICSFSCNIFPYWNWVCSSNFKISPFSNWICSFISAGCLSISLWKNVKLIWSSHIYDYEDHCLLQCDISALQKKTANSSRAMKPYCQTTSSDSPQNSKRQQGVLSRTHKAHTSTAYIFREIWGSHTSTEKTPVLWDMIVCRLIHRYQCFREDYHEDGSSKLVQYREAPEVEQKYSCILSLSLTLDGGGWLMPHPGHFNPGKETQYPLSLSMIATLFSFALYSIKPQLC
jgi:hypothetical protein